MDKDNITEDKIFNILEKIGFIHLNPHQEFYVTVLLHYKHYTFSKNFAINKTNPHSHYYLKLHSDYIIDNVDDKNRVYQIINQVFKKEIRLMKINKLMSIS